MRWGLTAMLLIVALGITGLGYWLYQRPAAQEQAAVASVTARASDLQSVIPILVAFNERLIGTDPADAESDLFAVEGAARSLFDVTGDLGDSQAGKRAASSQASASTLDAVRLAGEARSYRAAVTPLLVAPELETDRSFIELDEAARFFGDWQLSFDQVRTALPETVMEDVTEQLDILGGDLTSYLGRYVDALREDDQGAAETVVSDLGRRLAEIETILNTTLEEVQARVDARIQEATRALELILGR